MLLDNLNGAELPAAPHVVPTSLVIRESAPA
jgi:hypothetical protein